MDTGYYRKILEKRKSELLAWDESSRDSAKPVELDQTMVGRLTRMDAMQQQQMALATGRRRKQEILRIESALKRIETGDFGYCVKCDEEISPKRLELDPATVACVHCASGN